MTGPPANPLAQVGTRVLWDSLPVLFADRPWTRVHGVPVRLSGWSPGTRQAILVAANTALDRVRRALAWGLSAPLDLWASQVRTVRAILIESYRDLVDLAGESYREMARAAGDSLLLLAYRVAQALLLLAKGARAAWDAFWGIPPAVFAVAGLAFAAALFLGSVAAVLAVSGTALGLSAPFLYPEITGLIDATAKVGARAIGLGR